jgi:hypothetical protein
MKQLLTALLFVFLVGYVSASSHSEAPGTARTPQTDLTDFFAFRSYETGRSAFTTLIATVQGLQSPYAGPNYYSLSDQHFYEIYIDVDGDLNEDFTFQFLYGTRLGGDLISRPAVRGEFDLTFPDPAPTIQINGGLQLNIGGQLVDVALKFLGPITAGDTSALNWFETYQLNLLTGLRELNNSSPVSISGNPANTVFTKPFDYTGTKGFPDYDNYANQYIYNIDLPIAGCTTPGKVFVGQRRDPFVINLGGIFDLINFIPIPGFPGAIQESHFNNDINGMNIDAFALELPNSCFIPTAAQGVIGAWAAVRKLIHGPSGLDHIATDQTNRMANALVNELFIGLLDKNPWNLVKPVNDIPAGFDRYVRFPTFPAIIDILFRDAVNSVLGLNLASIAPTNFPRDDIFVVFMTGIPGINKPVLGVTPGDVMRLNTSIAARPARLQNSIGLINGDLGGYPNGRRPGDDVIDITLRVAVGKVCYLGLGVCQPSDAPIGNVDLTDGAPTSALRFDSRFPYFKTPLAGSGGRTPRQRRNNP